MNDVKMAIVIQKCNLKYYRLKVSLRTGLLIHFIAAALQKISSHSGLCHEKDEKKRIENQETNRVGSSTAETHQLYIRGIYI